MGYVKLTAKERFIVGVMLGGVLAMSFMATTALLDKYEWSYDYYDQGLADLKAQDGN